MIRIKQIKEFNIDFTKTNTILIVDSNNVIKNGLKYSAEYSSNSLVMRDNNGRIKINEPVDDLDAVNKSYFDNTIKDFLSVRDFDTNREDAKVENTNTIFWRVNNDKIQANVDLSLVSEGALLKIGVDDKGKKFVSATYLSEDTSSRSVDIQQYGNFAVNNNALKNINLRVYSAKNKAQTPDIAIIASSNDLDYSPNLSFYAYFDNNAIGSNGVTSLPVKAAQVLSSIDTFGAKESDNFENVFSIKVIADDDFSINSTNDAHLNVIQNNSLVFGTNREGDLFVTNGLILGQSNNKTVGNIIFDTNIGHFMGYNGSVWLPLDSNSGDSYINSDITSYYSIGGVKEGDVFKNGETLSDVVKKIFSPNMFDEFYIDFENAYAEDGGSLEVGQPVTVSNAVFSTNFNLDSAYIDGNGFDSTVAYVESPIEATESTKTFNIEEGSYIWTIATDEDIDVTPITQTVRTFTVYGRNSVRFGSSAYDIKNDSTNAQTVIDNLNYVLSDDFIGKGISFVTDSENKSVANYTYFAYPASWGDITKVFMHGVPIADTFEKVGTYNFTNQWGHSVLYVLYQSTMRGAYRIGTKITFK